MPTPRNQRDKLFAIKISKGFRTEGDAFNAMYEEYVEHHPEVRKMEGHGASYRKPAGEIFHEFAEKQTGKASEHAKWSEKEEKLVPR